MLGSLQQEETDSFGLRVTNDGQPDQQASAASLTIRLARLVYGGVLAFMAIDGLRNAEGRIQYAKAKNVPLPAASNYLAHGLLLAGGVGIMLWRSPKLAASAIIAFFAGVTPMMHDFWNVDDPEEKQQQMTQFLKNTALVGTALAFLGIAKK